MKECLLFFGQKVFSAKPSQH